MNEKVRWLNEFCVKCGERLNSWDKKCYTAFKMFLNGDEIYWIKF
jgi:hypothetical protein